MFCLRAKRSDLCSGRFLSVRFLFSLTFPRGDVVRVPSSECRRLDILWFFSLLVTLIDSVRESSRDKLSGINTLTVSCFLCSRKSPDRTSGPGPFVHVRPLSTKSLYSSMQPPRVSSVLHIALIFFPNELSAVGVLCSIDTSKTDSSRTRPGEQTWQTMVGYVFTT